MFDKRISQKHPIADGPDEKAEIDAFARRSNISADIKRHNFRKNRGLESNGYFESFSSAKRWYGQIILPLRDAIPPIYITKSTPSGDAKAVNLRNHYLMGVFLGPSITPYIASKYKKEGSMDLKDVFDALTNLSNVLEGGIIPIKPQIKEQSAPAAYFATPMTLGSLSRRSFRSIMKFDHPLAEHSLDILG